MGSGPSLGPRFNVIIFLKIPSPCTVTYRGTRVDFGGYSSAHDTPFHSFPLWNVYTEHWIFKA